MNSWIFLAFAVFPALLAAPVGKLSKGGIDVTQGFRPSMGFDSEKQALSYVPKEILEYVKSLTAEEKEDLNKIAQLAKDRHIILTMKNMPGLMREVSPSAYKKYEKMMDILKTKFNKLSKPTQDFISEVFDDFDKLSVEIQKHSDDDMKNLDAKMIKTIGLKLINLLRKVILFFEENKTGRKEIVEQWPEIGRFLKTNTYRVVKILAKIDSSVYSDLIQLGLDMKKQQQEQLQKLLTTTLPFDSDFA